MVLIGGAVCASSTSSSTDSACRVCGGTGVGEEGRGGRWVVEVRACALVTFGSAWWLRLERARFDRLRQQYSCGGGRWGKTKKIRGAASSMNT